MWYTYGPGGVPLPLAIGKEPPPEGQTIIEGITWSSAIDLGVLQPDNTYGMRAVNAAWKWFRGIDFP